MSGRKKSSVFYLHETAPEFTVTTEAGAEFSGESRSAHETLEAAYAQGAYDEVMSGATVTRILDADDTDLLDKAKLKAVRDAVTASASQDGVEPAAVATTASQG